MGEHARRALHLERWHELGRVGVSAVNVGSLFSGIGGSMSAQEGEALVRELRVWADSGQGTAEDMDLVRAAAVCLVTERERAERLEEALERIERLDWLSDMDTAREIARNALAEAGEE